MASGYVTSDGKDLDQRYLAIGDKAESAKVADRVSSSIAIRRAGNVVYATVSLPKNSSTTSVVKVPYTCPCSGVFGATMDIGVYVDFGGYQITRPSSQTGTSGYVTYRSFYANKGDVLTFVNEVYVKQTVYLHITPVSG